MKKERYVARPDEVVITRRGEYSEIRYIEPGVPSTSLKIGPEMAPMTDAEILAIYNDVLRSTARNAAAYQHVAVEVPLGSPQVRYETHGNQWVPRGSVLRCEILDDEEGSLVVQIDDREFTLEEFGRMLITHAGWGMRIEIVPVDQVHRRPTLEVREPDSE